jgi:hypothetical protein
MHLKDQFRQIEPGKARIDCRAERNQAGRFVYLLQALEGPSGVLRIVTAEFTGTRSAVSRYARSTRSDSLPSSSSADADTPTVRQIVGRAASHAAPDSRPFLGSA